MSDGKKKKKRRAFLCVLNLNPSEREKNPHACMFSSVLTVIPILVKTGIISLLRVRQ